MGGAVAAHQLEGGWNADGRGPSVSDVMTGGANGVARRITDGIVPGEFYPNHEGIDFYHTYPEDIKLLAGTGMNGLRTSINWARIFPNGDDAEPCEEGLKYYDNLIDCMIANGLDPMITISHYEMPLNLALKYNGWASRELVDFFVKYCETLFKRYNAATC